MTTATITSLTEPGAISDSKPVLTAQKLGYETGGRALLRDITFTLQPGEVIGVIGPNGAGKSTLLKLLSGDLVPTQGSITLGDSPLASYSVQELSKRRAVLPQQSVLQFAFTGRQVVEMGRSPHRGEVSRRRDAVMVGNAMKRTETISLANRVFPTLSGGEQSRISLARVLTQETPLLLLDEPTATLDLRHQGLVMETARELAKTGAAVLAILHDLNLAAAYTDRLAVLCNGELRAFDAPWAVLTAELLSEIYRCPIAVCPHPIKSCPLVMPLGV